MKVLVMYDADGNVQSVAIPNPKVARQVEYVDDGCGTVREFNVDRRVISPEALSGKRGVKARDRAYEALRRLV